MVNNNRSEADENRFNKESSLMVLLFLRSIFASLSLLIKFLIFLSLMLSLVNIFFWKLVASSFV